MRLNKFLSDNSSLSRRKADEAIVNGRVSVNDKLASLGQKVDKTDTVKLDDVILAQKDSKPTTLLLDKPVGYVCSRNGQGSPTVYELIPKKYHHLNIAGRLDKDSSGLVVMTDDGELLNELTHPSKNKEKVYEVTLDKELTEEELKQFVTGVDIGDDRPSKFKSITRIGPKKYKIVLEEGRNRQIRRTLNSLDNEVQILRRISVSRYTLSGFKECVFKII